MSKLTAENLEQYQHDKHRKMSVYHKEGSDSTGQGPAVVGPNIRRTSRLVEPRMSVSHGFGRRYSQVSRTSFSGTSGITKYKIPVKIANTYRLGPNKDEQFNSSKVEKLMTGVLESYLDGETYEPKMCSHLAQNLSEVIKERVKELNFPRYKFICSVVIGQNLNHGVHMASRFLWNNETDNYATATYSKGQMYATATIFATYFE